MVLRGLTAWESRKSPGLSKEARSSNSSGLFCSRKAWTCFQSYLYSYAANALFSRTASLSLESSTQGLAETNETLS